MEEEALSEEQEPIANDLSEGDEQAEGALSWTFIYLELYSYIFPVDGRL